MSCMKVLSNEHTTQKAVMSSTGAARLLAYPVKTLRCTLSYVHMDGPSGVDEGMGAMTPVTVRSVSWYAASLQRRQGHPETVHSLRAVPASRVELLQELQALLVQGCKALLHSFQSHCVSD
jgi:hypothetical protein